MTDVAKHQEVVDAAEKLIAERNGTPYEDDWDLADAALLVLKESQRLKARIAELEKLGPLIEELKRRAYSTGVQRTVGDTEWQISQEKMREAESKINAILKGES